MSVRVQKICALGGAGMALLFLLGFTIAGFVVPPSPGDDKEEIARLFVEDKNRIRAGMIVTLFGAALMMPWLAVISVQIKRIEGKYSTLAYTQLGLGTALMLEFTLPLIVWEAATFRADRDPGDIQAMNDICWILYVGLTATGLAQAVVIGAAILTDRRAEPVFPRWAGYFNIWVALMFICGTFNVFFKDGPLAWDGAIAWYLVLTVFCIWLPVLTWLLFKAVDQQAREEVDAPGAGELSLESLSAEVAQLRRELGQRPDRTNA